MNRRKFLGCISMAVLTAPLLGAQQSSYPFGLIVRLKTVPGRRDELIATLKEGATELPGCLSYVIANDTSDNDVVWITEVWEGVASHDASLSRASVKGAMAKAKGLISEFSRIAVTNPVWAEMPPMRPLI